MIPFYSGIFFWNTITTDLPLCSRCRICTRVLLIMKIKIFQSKRSYILRFQSEKVMSSQDIFSMTYQVFVMKLERRNTNFIWIFKLDQYSLWISQKFKFFSKFGHFQVPEITTVLNTVKLTTIN